MNGNNTLLYFYSVLVTENSKLEIFFHPQIKTKNTFIRPMIFMNPFSSIVAKSL